MPVSGKLESIKAATAQATGLTGVFVDEVDLRLQSLGYTLRDSDSCGVAFAIQKVVSEIRNECNLGAVPEGLFELAVDMVCGEFLLAQKGSGQLDGFNAELGSAVLKQIQEGDTNVVFAAEGISSPEKRLDAVIEHLINRGRGQFASYRRLKWT